MSGLPGMWSSGALTFSREIADVANDPGEIDPAIARRIERLVDFLGMLSKRGCRTGGLRCVLCEREILYHQRRSKSGLVVVVCRRRRHRARHRTIGGQGPALP